MEEIPEFIKLRGCINCKASKQLKEETGHDYGFDHEIMSRCLILGCVNYEKSLCNPFIDPEEIYKAFIKYQTEHPEKDVKNNVYKAIANIKDTFGKYYDRIGISLDSYLDKLK
ncbi:MAG: hypothetical protein ACOYT4_04160 [Nanoarchaeota archaeon]